MILTKKEILKAVKTKEIKIEPFNPKNVGSGSVDLTLDNQFRIFNNAGIIELDENIDYKKYARLVTREKIILKPGEMILGITKEKITLPGNMCGWLQGRTRFARLGLNVHITASFVQPGSENKQVLEIINMNKIPMEIKAGTKICQIVFERAAGSSKEKSKYTYNQKL